ARRGRLKSETRKFLPWRLLVEHDVRSAPFEIRSPKEVRGLKSVTHSSAAQPSPAAGSGSVLGASRERPDGGASVLASRRSITQIAAQENGANDREFSGARLSSAAARERSQHLRIPHALLPA